MPLVDESLFERATELIPTIPLLRRIEAIQHDHITDSEELESEAECARGSLCQTLRSLPAERVERYLQVYVELQWSVAMMLFAVAQAEHSGENYYERLVGRFES